MISSRGFASPSCGILLAMLPRITVKNAGPGSLGVLIKLWHQAWYAQCSREAHHAYRMRLFTTPWARKNLEVLVLEENGAPLSGMMALSFRMKLGGRRLKVAGVAAVVTAPEQRGRGLAARLMSIAHRRFQDSGHDAALLFSDIGTDYYARFGYVPWPTTRFTLQVPPGSLARGYQVRAARMSDLPALRALQDGFQKPFAFKLERPVAYWRHQHSRALGRDELLGITPPSWGRFVIETKNNLVAYIRLAVRDRLLVVSEAAHLPRRENALAELIADRARVAKADGISLLAPESLVDALRLPVARREACDKMMVASLSPKAPDVSPVSHCFWGEDWF